jgi:hypothetical protein
MGSSRGFSTAGPIWKRILRFGVRVIGILVFDLGWDMPFGLIAQGAEAVFPSIPRYIRYTLVGAWVSAGAPWVLVKLKLAGKAA